MDYSAKDSDTDYSVADFGKDCFARVAASDSDTAAYMGSVQDFHTPVAGKVDRL